jgi:DNA-binding transcriptional ArsR family regulator
MTTPGRVLDALGEANRRHLLELLHQHGESTVTALVDRSGLRQPSVSKHLKVLSEADLVAVRPEGRRRHYRLDPTGLRATYEWFASFEDVWQQRFDALDALLSSDDSDEQASGSPAVRTDKDPS